MNKTDIFEKVKEIFESFFNGEVSVDMNTTMETLDEWESVSHIQLIFEIEENFNIEFEAEVIADLTSIKKIVDYVEKKL